MVSGRTPREKTWPVGSLKPNELGLFDVQGNVYTWCQEEYSSYPQGEETKEDKEDILSINRQGRVLRGGSLFNQASIVRSANRKYNPPGAPRLLQRVPSGEDFYALTPFTRVPKTPPGATFPEKTLRPGCERDRFGNVAPGGVFGTRGEGRRVPAAALSPLGMYYLGKEESHSGSTGRRPC